ncbi:hypothetical protein H4S03_008308 [Coemansia sp. S3946]|nr:hypothetical protein H4S03_008308 [Coemansia sp. S3946]
MDNQNSTYSPPKLAASLQSPPAYSGNSVQQQEPQVVYALGAAAWAYLPAAVPGCSAANQYSICKIRFQIPSAAQPSTLVTIN